MVISKWTYVFQYYISSIYWTNQITFCVINASIVVILPVACLMCKISTHLSTNLCHSIYVRNGAFPSLECDNLYFVQCQQKNFLYATPHRSIYSAHKVCKMTKNWDEILWTAKLIKEGAYEIFNFWHIIE